MEKYFSHKVSQTMLRGKDGVSNTKHRAVWIDRGGKVEVDFHIVSNGAGWGFTVMFGRIPVTSEGFPTFPQALAAAGKLTNGAPCATTTILQGLCEEIRSLEYTKTLSEMADRGEVIDAAARLRVSHSLYMTVLVDLQTRDAALCAAIEILLMKDNVEVPPHGSLFLNCTFKCTVDNAWHLRPLRSE